MSERGRDVLIIDGQRVYRDRIASILSSEDLSVHLADSMDEARARMAPPALVLLDLQLPGSDGLEDLDYWLGLEVPPRVIVLSEATAQEQVLDALRRGAADYLAKPLHAEELRLSVRRGLQSWTLAGNLRGLEAQLEKLAVRSESLCGEIEAATDPDAVEGLIHQAIVDMACDVLDARRASLLRLDAEEDHLVLLASGGERRAPESIESVGLGGGSVSGVVFERGEAIWVRDIRTDPDLAALSQPDRYQSRSFLAVPVSGADGSIVAMVYASEPAGQEGFGPGDLSLLRLVVQPLASRWLMSSDSSEPPQSSSPADHEFETGLEGLSSQTSSALTADVLPKPDVEDELDRDAEIAREICQAVADEVDPTRVISVVLARVAALLPAAPASLYVADPTDGRLRCESSLDGGVCEDRTDLLPRRGLTGVVFQTGQLVASDDPASDPRFDPEVDTPLSGDSRPLLCLPLRLRGKTVGLFRAFLPETDRVSPRTGEVLAAALSAALRSVLLYRSLVVSIEEVAEARRENRG